MPRRLRVSKISASVVRFDFQQVLLEVVACSNNTRPDSVPKHLDYAFPAASLLFVIAVCGFLLCSPKSDAVNLAPLPLGFRTQRQVVTVSERHIHRLCWHQCRVGLMSPESFLCWHQCLVGPLSPESCGVHRVASPFARNTHGHAYYITAVVVVGFFKGVAPMWFGWLLF